MTKEEAINVLKTHYHKNPRTSYGVMVKQATEMAVKALGQEPILDKIRAEIEQLRLHKSEFLTNDGKVCIDSQEVLAIIDKYKAESEE